MPFLEKRGMMVVTDDEVLARREGRESGVSCCHFGGEEHTFNTALILSSCWYVISNELPFFLDAA
jgi:hypothetical protein